jgi:putative redox protein
MKVNLKTNEKELGYIGTNANGHQIELNGNKEGVGPMESVLLAAAACSTIDVELILKKMKQNYTSIEVEVEAERATDEIPAVFKKISLHYIVTGEVKKEKLEQAVELSVTTYCSVLKMLEKTADIIFTASIKN